MTVPRWAGGPAWPEGLWTGAQSPSDTFYFSVFFVLRIRCPNKRSAQLLPMGASPSQRPRPRPAPAAV